MRREELPQVERIIDVSHRPWLPPPLFAAELAGLLVGWLLRAVGILDAHRNPLSGGWRSRPAFKWEMKKHFPHEVTARLEFPDEAWATRKAEEAVAAAREELAGEWNVSTRSAQATLRRMASQRDAVATRDAVNTIVVAHTTPLQERFDAKVEKLDAKVDGLETNMRRLEGKIDRILEHLGTTTQPGPSDSSPPRAGEQELENIAEEEALDFEDAHESGR